MLERATEGAGTRRRLDAGGEAARAPPLEGVVRLLVRVRVRVRVKVRVGILGDISAATFILVASLMRARAITFPFLLFSYRRSV